MRGNRHVLLILITLVCVFKASFAQLPFKNQYRFIHFNTEDGLANNNVMSITQDSYGFIWMATFKGLIRYDGFKMYNYQHNIENSTSFSSGRVRKVFVDSKNNVWAISGSDGLNLYDRESDSFIRYQHDPNNINSISNNQVRDIIEDNEGRLWIGTKEGGLNLFVDGKFQRILNNGKENYDVISIFEDNDGSLLLDINSAGEISRFDPINNTFKQIEFDENAKARTPYYGMSFARKGNKLWIGTSGSGLYCLENNKVKSHFDYGIVTDLFSYSDNELWIAIDGGGIRSYDFNSNSFSHITHNKGDPHSLSNNQINCIFRDSQDVIWIGTYAGGVNKLKSMDFKSVYPNILIENSLSDSRIISLLEDKNENVWIGTDGGGLNVTNKDGFFKHYKKDNNRNSISGNVIMGLMEDKEGRIWITTYGNGISILDPITDKFEYINTDKTFWPIIQDKQGTVWTGETENILASIDSKTLEVSKVSLSHTLDTYRFAPYILEDSDGVIWVSVTEKGLFKVIENNLVKVDLGIFNNCTIVSMCEASGSNLWLGVEGFGLFLFNKKTESYQLVFENTILANSTIVSIQKDKQSNLWLGSGQGLIKHNPITSNTRIYQLHEGLISKHFSYGASLTTQNGYMLFGTSKGLTYFHPDSITNNSFTPPVILTSFEIFDQEISVNKNGPLKSNILLVENIDLHYSESSITIAYNALDNVHDDNKYSYFMEGVDKEWSIPSYKKEKSYTSLQSGSFLFKVKAQNDDGVWGKERVLNINVSTPWWEMPITLAGYFLLLFMLITVAFQYRMKSVNSQKNKLSILVKEQTQGLVIANEALLKQNQEIETKSDQLKKSISELKSTQSQLIQSEKMSSIGQLTASVAHEINNPVNFITAGASSLVLDFQDLMKYITFSESDKRNNSDELKKLKDEIDFEFLTGNIQQTIEDIRNGGYRTAEIVKELRTFSRMDEENFKKADIHKGIESTLVLLQGSLKNGIILEKKLSPTSFDIECYPGQLNQVFMNLLTNAIQAMSGKGILKISTIDEGEDVSISIKDSGPGIPIDIREKIFDPFFTTKSVGEGTGLGLSISYRIVEKHGGTINIICEEGCEFIVRLPKKQKVSSDKNIKV